MTGEPSQYPAPVARGGSPMAADSRTLRGPIAPPAGARDMRQPYLDSVPAVASVTGFGTGSGAGIRNQGSDADQSQGLVMITVGIGAATSGTVGLNFPAAIPAAAGGFFVAADWVATITGALAGQVLTISWTAAAAPMPGKPLFIAYQWQTSV